MNNLYDSFANYLPTQEPLHLAFTNANAQYVAGFRAIGSKCDYLQDSIESLLKKISMLQTKMRIQIEMSDKYKMGQLREKQKQFIISQLQQKVKRLQSSQENFQSLLMQKQTIAFQLKDKCQQLRNDNAQLKQQLAKKTKQIKQLIKTNSSLKMEKMLSQSKNKDIRTKLSTPNLSELSAQKQQAKQQNQYYQQLQSKLKEMQDCLNGQIQQYKKKNDKLQQQIRNLNNQLKKESGNVKKIFELQLRIKNLRNQNKQLEQSFTNQLALNNESQVKFHKKINELKVQIHQQKKLNKNIIKQCEKQLKQLSAAVLGANDKPTIFIGATTPSQQFSELAKQIIKNNKKQLTAIKYEKDAIIQELKLNNESNQTKIKQLTTLLQKSKQQLKNQKSQKNPLMNGVNMANKSASKSDLEIRQSKEKDKLHQKVQQKYQQIIQQYKVQIQEKQKLINQTRKKNDQDFTKVTTKNLEMQAKLAELQMQIKYNSQKYDQIQKNSQETVKNSKLQKQKEVGKLKQKIKQIQNQRDQLKTKIRQIQQKLYAKDKIIKQFEKKEKQSVEKIKRLEKRQQTKLGQYKALIEAKEKSITQMIDKNQSLSLQIKLLNEKNKISANLNSLKNIPQPETPTFSPIDKIKQQFLCEKQELLIEITKKENEIQNLKSQIEDKKDIIKKKQQKLDELTLQKNKLSNDNKLLKSQNEVLKQTGQKLKSSKSNENANNFSQLRVEYEKREKIAKAQVQKIIAQNKSSKKQLQQKNRKIVMEITQLKQQNTKMKHQIAKHEQQHAKFDAQKAKNNERQKTMKEDHKLEIEKLNQKIKQLLKSKQQIQKAQIQTIHKGFSFGKETSKERVFKGTQSVEYVQFGVGTQKIQKTDQGINTIDIFALETNKDGNNNILDFNDELNDPNSNHLNSRQQEKLRNSNLFMNLNEDVPVTDDVFQICDQNEEVNFGQSSTNLQIREMFTSLRIEIQKLFNQEQISLAVTKLLPPALQDDYFQLMSYIKQKIADIRVNNQISFIMAEPGNQPQPPLEDSLQFPELCRRHSEGESLKKIIEQKDALINSLMNERTSQQNTINQLTVQKQEIQQQNENRFMNQCNVYKKEIKEHKKQIDVLQMNFQSMKNVVRNVLEAYSTDEDMEDDFRESMTMYARVAKLTQKERSRINFYIQCYTKIKGLDGTN